MSIVNYKAGNIVYLGNDQYEILKPVSLRDVLAKSVATGVQKVLPVLSLRSAPLSVENGDTKTPVEHVDEDHWDVAVHRHKIIKPLLEAPHLTRAMVIKVAKQWGLSPSTVYRHLSMFKTTGTVSALVPKFDLRGKGTSKLPPGTLAIVEDMKDNFYLNPTKEHPKPTIKESYSEIKQRCKTAGVRIPAKGTVYSLFGKIPASDLAKRREGKSDSGNKFLAKPGKFPGGNYPLDVIQIDHTPLNVMVVDEIYRESIKRPYLTVAIDVNSRMVYGYYIALEKPSYYSVSQCITIGILPKDQFLRSISVEGQWDIWGKPRLILADNAWEFQGQEMTRVCADHDIILEWTPVKKPEYKAHIERLCGTLSEKIRRLQGATFASIEERGSYDSEEEAVMTMAELEKWFGNMVVNEYHNDIHTGIGMTPKRKYEMGILGDGTTPGVGLPSAIEDEDQLRISLLPFEERVVQKTGLWIECIQYWSDTLKDWANVKNKKSKNGKYIIKINPKSMKIVHFYDPELKRYFPVPYRDISKPDMTIWELRDAKAYLKKQGIEHYDEAKIFEAVTIGKKIAAEATDKTKQARRKAAAKNFHDRKLKDERSSVAASRGKDESGIAAATPEEKAIELSLDDLYRDIKPFTGIKVIPKKEDDKK